MNFKKIILTSIAAASLCVVAGTAVADMTADVNIYGASAQYKLWTAKAADFMAKQGCTVQGITAQTSDGKNSITKATCPSGDRYVRVSSKASFDGVLAAQGNTTNPYRVSECTNANQRKMADPTTCNFTTGVCSAASTCVPVTVGASDVPVECFKQESDGDKNGPQGGGNLKRNFKSNPLSWSGTAPCKPLVVPFAFFANKSVKLSDGSTTITDIRRDTAELIFNGQVYDWSDLLDANNTAYYAQAINVCLRHAGSGTHASLDALVSSPMIVQQMVDGDTHYYFNDGSTEMMKCVNGVGAWSGAGAIGYADADQSLTDYGNVARLTLNGVACTAIAIKKGNYNFYGMQHLYGIGTSDPLCTYAGNSANLGAYPYWVASSAMQSERTKVCESFPIRLK